jgi:hypothetical protein
MADKRRVSVKLQVYVSGQVSDNGDVRELEPIVAAVVNGAADGYRSWVKNAGMAEDEPCEFDYSVQLSNGGKRPRSSRRRHP